MCIELSGSGLKATLYKKSMLVTGVYMTLGEKMGAQICTLQKSLFSIHASG